MPTRNFDSNFITLRKQAQYRSGNIYNNMTNGLPIISNPFTSDYGYNRINTYHVGSQTMYLKA